MPISKILKQLTPERKKKEIEAIKNMELPKELQEWVKRYEKVGERDEFFWKFIYRLNGTIDPFGILNESVKSIKTLFVVFVVLVDDIAEKSKNKKLLNNLLTIPLKNNFYKGAGLTKREKDYLKLSINLWEYIQKAVKQYNGYKNFEEIFYFDVEQIFNAIEYSYLVNKNSFLINEKEHWTYSPYTLQGMINCVIDLMNISNLNIEEIGKIREVFLSAQKMARIANCFATWEKEIYDNDFTNSLLVYAIERQVLQIKDLGKDKKDIIKKINKSRIKNELFQEWEYSYIQVDTLCKKIKSIKGKEFLLQIEELSLLYLLTGSLSK
ncbi:MAG: hypothetical protein U9Q16_01120 [Patescibacteria group bacterium]|nr:hypothetical protein [Patescibacteria group bacterium]